MTFCPEMPTCCPKCGVTWESENEIPHDLYHSTGLYCTHQDAVIAAGHYGWTEENQLKFKVNMIGWVDRYKYDGVSYWHCLECLCFVDRFTGLLTKERPEE